MKAYSGNTDIPEPKNDRRSDTWVPAILENKQTPGSFINAETVTETINLAAIALRAGKRVDYDSKSMKITNDDALNKYLTREYRKGWEL